MTSFFFFNDTATTEIYTLSLHDALPIFDDVPPRAAEDRLELLDDLPVAAHGAVEALQVAVDDEDEVVELLAARHRDRAQRLRDRKSTRLNSSHANISYAVFCLKKKNHTSE